MNEMEDCFRSGDKKRAKNVKTKNIQLQIK